MKDCDRSRDTALIAAGVTRSPKARGRTKALPLLSPAQYGTATSRVEVGRLCQLQVLAGLPDVSSMVCSSPGQHALGHAMVLQCEPARHGVREQRVLVAAVCGHDPDFPLAGAVGDKGDLRAGR